MKKDKRNNFNSFSNNNTSIINISRNNDINTKWREWITSKGRDSKRENRLCSCKRKLTNNVIRNKNKSNDRRIKRNKNNRL